MIFKRRIRLLSKFFSGKLSRRERRQFIEKASSDKEFIKEFVKGIQLNEVIEEETEENDEPESENED